MKKILRQVENHLCGLTVETLKTISVFENNSSTLCVRLTKKINANGFNF